MPRAFGKCPPGVFCLTPGIILGGILLVALIALVAWKGVPRAAVQAQPAAVLAPPPAQPVAIQVISEGGGDDRYTRAPKPERHWATRPELPTAAEMYGKIGRVPTRGLPEAYQSMGVVKMEDGQLLPLYGRRTASRSDRFQYYTRTDTYNPVQLPIQHKRRDCQDDIGCEELYDGDQVNVSTMGQKGQVTVYRFDAPTYVPGIL